MLAIELQPALAQDRTPSAMPCQYSEQVFQAHKVKNAVQAELRLVRLWWAGGTEKPDT